MARGPSDPRPVPPSGPMRGVARVPGSKSLTNRSIALASLARGTTVLRGALRSADTQALAGAVDALGAPVRWGREGDADVLEVQGADGHFPPGPPVSVHAGDGGTPARFAMALASFAQREVVIDGSARLRERPMADGVRLLRALGVEVACGEAEDRLPVRIDAGAGPPQGGAVTVGPVASSQFVSALLLVAPWMRQGLRVRFDVAPVSSSYVALTVSELHRWGAQVAEERAPDGGLRELRVGHGPLVSPGTVGIEPDASSALYWAGAAALVPGSAVEIAGLPSASTQPDRAAIAALGAMGAVIGESAQRPGSLEVRCSLAAADRSPPLRGRELDLADAPDGALMVIAAAAAAEGPTVVRGLGTLRAKESDRIAAMAQGLRRIGATVEYGTDWMRIQAPPPGWAVRATIDPHGDHRIAMSFAVLGLRLGGIEVADPSCVEKSYPGFWRELDRLRSPPGHHRVA
jgi:3-phosphoshikimate 1-carboxyvinyltransferase